MNAIRKWFSENKEEMLRAAVKSALTFSAVWAGNAVLDFVLYFIFNNLFSVPSTISQIISYTCATVNRFYMTKIIKYKDRKQEMAVREQLIRFLTMAFLILSSSSLLMTLLRGFGLAALPSKLLVTGYTTAMNIVSHRYIVFKNEKSRKNKK